MRTRADKQNTGNLKKSGRKGTENIQFISTSTGSQEKEGYKRKDKDAVKRIQSKIRRRRRKQAGESNEKLKRKITT